MEAHVLKLNKVPLFAQRRANINVSRSTAPNVCAKFFRIDRGSDGAHVLKLNKVPLFAKKQVNVNVARSAAPKLAIVLASRYNCDVK